MVASASRVSNSQRQCASHSASRSWSAILSLSRRWFQVLQPWCDFLGQQTQRIVPGLGVLDIVEAEHQQAAEAAGIVVYTLELLGHRRGRADDPIVLRAIGRRHVGIRDVRIMLEEFE